MKRTRPKPKPPYSVPDSHSTTSSRLFPFLLRLARLRLCGFRLLLVILTITTLLPSGVQCQDTKTLSIDVLPITYDGSYVTSLNFSRVMAMAIEDVRGQDLLPGYDMKLTSHDPGCGKAGLLIEDIVNQAVESGADVFMGPQSTISGTSLAEMAAEHGVAFIDCFQYAITAEEEHEEEEEEDHEPTVNSVLSDYLKIVRGILASLHHVGGWKRVSIGQSSVHEHTGFDMLTMSEHLEALFVDDGSITVNTKEVFSMAAGYVGIERTLIRLAAKSRIIILLAYTEEVQASMLVAYDLGFFDHNEFVFITIDPGTTEEALTFQWLYTGDPEQDRKLDIAYKSCLHITKIPYFMDNGYQQFLNRVQQRLLDPPFEATLKPTSQVTQAAAYVYDAVMLYALTADSMIRQGLDPTDGRAFTQHAKTIRFDGKTGAVSVNVEGQRNDDYAIYDFDNGTFRQVGRFDGFTDELILFGQIKWGPDDLDEPPPDTPMCGYLGELCIKEEELDLTLLISGCVFGVLAILAIGIGIHVYRKKAFEAELNAANWKIDPEELKFTKDRAKSAVSVTSLGSNQQNQAQAMNVAIFKNEKVYVKRINKMVVEWKKRAILIEMKIMRDVRHENINTFIGACVEPGQVYVVSRLCAKGGLDDLLQNTEIQLDLMFRISIAMDIISGLKYISKSEIGFHGNLQSPNCLVDSRWTVKLSGFGLREFSAQDKGSQHEILPYNDMLWTAPEHLRDGSDGSVKGDIYSYAIILQEIALRSGPYSENDGYMAPKDIIERVKDTSVETPFRPVIPANSCEPMMAKLMANCWSENPADRPDFASIQKDLRTLNGGKSINIMDNMVSMLEKYASNLEGIVEERTKELVEEKKKTDMLISQMLPESVARQLKDAGSVDPEAFDQVTIFFSDIVGFTALSSESTPIEVVNLLNDLYTCFDSILMEYDCYKVETIGDAYMVASGLPIRNGNRHAGEISSVSLHLLSSVLSFRIRHRPNQQLKLRVGIHSGPCVSGVVGLKMPRYCLFGDTVNTASRMESNGKAFRIHVSKYTKRYLDEIGGFHTVERGLVEMKGKGSQMTYWLQGKDGFNLPLPDFSKMID